MTDVLTDELFLAALINGLSEAVLVAEPGKPHYVYVNAATEALLGYTRNELLALGPRDISGPESLQALPEMALSLEQHGRWQGTWQLRRKDGQTIDILATASRQVHRGRVFYQGLARPLAERVADQREPRPAARLLEATGQAVLAVDMDGILTFWNRAAESFYGRPADEALGRHILDLIPPGPQRDEAARTVARIQAGETIAGETIVVRPDGAQFRALVTGSPIREEDGRQVGILGVAVRADAAMSTTPSVEQQPGMRQRRALVHCASCGREVPGTARRRYCSEKCRQWAYYHRNIEAQRQRSRTRYRQGTDAPQSSDGATGREDGGDGANGLGKA
jgi:PAS domain S-box-containing protein